jgi:Tol biopolymer transport system component
LPIGATDVFVILRADFDPLMLSPGERIGTYEVVAFVGSGGMGEVYRAHDTRLGRVVALKILRDTLLQHPEPLARFRREAQLLASLNHPHIAVVYGLEESEHRLAIALEFVEGEGLEARLAGGPMPIAEVMMIGRQIAEGLEAAHERGIVHRDLKPANVRLTPEGRVKILDFGLAKALEQSSEGSTSSAATATVAQLATSAGMIVGTAAYMAPEQARGKAVDKRADIWAFGVLLFELVTGQRPFEGDTLGDTLAAVLTREVDLGKLPSATPDAIRTLLARCLERDVTLRLRDIGEARIVLSGAPSATSATAPLSRPARRGPGALVVLAATIVSLILGAAGHALWSTSRAIPDAEPLPMTLGIDAGINTPIAGAGWVGLNWVGSVAELSPDGRMFAFVARGPSGGRWQLYLRRFNDLTARPLAGTEDAYAPFFSPDGGSIGFFSGGRLLTLALNSGTVTPLAKVFEARGGTWSEDGTIVFAARPDGPLSRIAATGGEITQLTTLDTTAGETTHRWPQFLPDGRGLMFTAHGSTGAAKAGDVIVQSGTERRIIHRGALFGRYSRSGHLLYVNAGKLFATPFDINRLQETGPSVAVVDDIAFSPLNGTGQYSLSNAGTLTYRRARGANRMLLWMDPSGQTRPLRNVPTEYQEARISPDGNQLLLAINDGTQTDIWIYALARDAITRLTFYADNDWSPIWSADAQHVVYCSWQPDVGTFNLFLARADGSGEPKRLTTSTDRQNPVDWHPGGKYILFTEDSHVTGGDLMLLPIDVAAGGVKVGAPQPFLNTPANEVASEFSPDGKWVAYTSDESGRNEVYVRPFPSGAGRWQVSTEGAEWIKWRRDGQLYYGISDDVVMRVPYGIEGRTFRAERPQVWMRIPRGVVWVDPFDNSKGAIVIRSDDARTESVVLVTNFFELLRRRAQAAR